MINIYLMELPTQQELQNKSLCMSSPLWECKVRKILFCISLKVIYSLGDAETFVLNLIYSLEDSICSVLHVIYSLGDAEYIVLYLI